MSGVLEVDIVEYVEEVGNKLSREKISNMWTGLRDDFLLWILVYVFIVASMYCTFSDTSIDNCPWTQLGGVRFLGVDRRNQGR